MSSRSVKLTIDGSILNMVTDVPMEHVQKVSTFVNDSLEFIKNKNLSMNSLQIYRYTMVYLADQLVELKEIVDIDGLKKDVSDNELKELRRKTKILEEENEEARKRIEELQKLLLEQNKELKAYANK